MSIERDFYKVLQIDPEAEEEVVKAAYWRLSKKYHPDHNKSSDALARMKELNEAYETLSDPIKRRAYDQTRQAAPKPEPPEIILSTTAISFRNVTKGESRSDSFTVINRGGAVDSVDVKWETQPSWATALNIVRNPNTTFPITCTVIVTTGFVTAGTYTARILINVDETQYVVNVTLVVIEPVTQQVYTTTQTHTQPAYTATIDTSSIAKPARKGCMPIIIAGIAIVAVSGLLLSVIKPKEPTDPPEATKQAAENLLNSEPSFQITQQEWCNTQECEGAQGVEAIAWSPDSNLIGVVNKSDNNATLLSIWDIKSSAVEKQLIDSCPNDEGGSGNKWLTLSWSPNGKMLAVAGSTTIWGSGEEQQSDNSITIWNTTNWSIVQCMAVGPIDRVRWSADSLWFAGSNHDNAVYVWNTHTWRATAFEGYVTQSSKGLMLFKTLEDQEETTIIGIPEGNTIYSSKELPRFCVDSCLKKHNATWSPKGTYVIFDDNYSLFVWETASWQQIWQPDLNYVEAVSWGSDETKFAVIDSDELVVLDLLNQITIKREPGDYDDLMSLAWSPNGKWIVTTATKTYKPDGSYEPETVLLFWETNP